MKIVVYDSGIGGRVVYDLLKQKTISHSNIEVQYFSDHSNFPYGTKSEEELQQIVLGNFQMFKNVGFEHIVVACNTASGIIDDILSKNEHARTVNVHTIIQPTIHFISSKDIQHLFIIGSEYTIHSRLYSKSLQSMKVPFEITEKAEQELIIAIENEDKEKIMKYIQRVIKDIPNNSHLLLACTHYSLVKREFESEISKQSKSIEIIDPSKILADETVGKLLVEVQKSE